MVDLQTLVEFFIPVLKGSIISFFVYITVFLIVKLFDLDKKWPLLITFFFFLVLLSLVWIIGAWKGMYILVVSIGSGIVVFTLYLIREFKKY